ncbi:MAG: hypothetical protein IKQ39_08570 [Oscillospiraceae bacterium]|nr:hypothetical protein [Oscillospiraceae bacterium]
MLIDASLGRAGCCPYPPYPFPPQPVPPQPAPPVPVPLTEPDTLCVQLATAQTALANGAAVPMTGTLRQTGNGLSYDAASRAVTVTEAGVYAFAWQILVQSDGAAADAVIALQSLDGQTVLGYSGAIDVPETGSTLVSGSAVAYLPAGTAWVLVNVSGAAINIPVTGTAPAVFAASMTVSEVGSTPQLR